MKGWFDKLPSDETFREHLAALFSLPREEIDRLLAEVFEYYGESLEAVIQKRHGELQKQGLKNAEIFRVLLAEAEGRLFAPPSLSLRRIRRMIYG